jgi:hypothetical protein
MTALTAAYRGHTRAAVALGATEQAAAVKALPADLMGRGLRPDIAACPRALSRTVCDTFGDFALISCTRDAILLEAEKSFRRLKAYRQFPTLSTALLRHQQMLLDNQLVGRKRAGRIQPMVPALRNFSRHRDCRVCCVLDTQAIKL